MVSDLRSDLVGMQIIIAEMCANHSAHFWRRITGMILLTAIPGAILLIMLSEFWGGIALAYTLVLVICSVKHQIFIFSNPTDVKLSMVLLPYGALCIGICDEWAKWHGIAGYSFVGLGGIMLIATFISGCKANGSFVKGVLSFPAKMVLAALVISMGLFCIGKAMDTKRDMNRRQWGNAASDGAITAGAGMGMLALWKFIRRLMPQRLDTIEQMK